MGKSSMPFLEQFCKRYDILSLVLTRFRRLKFVLEEGLIQTTFKCYERFEMP